MYNLIKESEKIRGQGIGSIKKLKRLRRKYFTNTRKDQHKHYGIEKTDSQIHRTMQLAMIMASLSLVYK